MSRLSAKLPHISSHLPIRGIPGHGAKCVESFPQVRRSTFKLLLMFRTLRSPTTAGLRYIYHETLITHFSSLRQPGPEEAPSKDKYRGARPDPGLIRGSKTELLGPAREWKAPCWASVPGRARLEGMEARLGQDGNAMASLGNNRIPCPCRNGLLGQRPPLLASRRHGPDPAAEVATQLLKPKWLRREREAGEGSSGAPANRYSVRCYFGGSKTPSKAPPRGPESTPRARKRRPTKNTN